MGEKGEDADEAESARGEGHVFDDRGVQQQIPHAGPTKNGLRHHATTDYERETQDERGYDGEKSVARSVSVSKRKK